MIKINAIGDVCPVPVIKTKKALAEAEAVEITVDNLIATQNLKKLAEQKNYHFSDKMVSPKEYIVIISKNANGEVSPAIVEEIPEKQSDDYIVVVDTDIMGRGNDQLGATLMKSFFYALTEQEVLPQQVILYNGCFF